MYAELIPTGILLGASFFDIKSRKVPNYFIVGLLVFSLIFVTLNSEDKLNSFFGFLTAFLITVPLWLIHALGAADVKVFSVFGLLTNTQVVLDVFIFSIVIAVFIGIIKTVLDGNIKVFVSNFKDILTLKKPKQESLNKIPFTIAILLGWVCYLIQNHYGRLI